MRKSSLYFRALHLALGLSLPFVLTFLMGCKRAKEEKGDLGSQASPEAVEAAINAAVSGRTLSALNKDQFVEYSSIRRIENQESTITLGGLHVSVLSAQENDSKTETKYIFQIARTYRTESGGFKTDYTETDPWIVPKNSVPPETSFGATKMAEIRKSMAKTRAKLRAQAAAKGRVSASEDSENPTTTYHNLRVSDGAIAAPGGVASKPGCGGLPNCAMNVRYVRFDIVDWYSATDYQKVSIDFAFSLQPPYLPISRSFFDLLNGILVIDCRSTTIPIEDRKVYVRDCKQLENYNRDEIKN